MNKIVKGGIVSAIVGVVLIALPALATTNLTFIDFPGSGTNITAQVGSTVNVKDTFTLDGNSTLQSISHQLVDFNGNDIGMPEVCSDVNDRNTAGTYTVTSSFDTTGGTEGTYGIRVRAYGFPTPQANNNCTGTPNDNEWFPNRITLTDNQNTGTVANNTGGGTTNNGGSSVPSWLQLLINALRPQTAPAPVTSAVCVAYNQASIGTMQGVRNAANVRLQGFLLSQGESIPALAAGASFGFFGSQTAAAQMAFLAANHCQ